MTTRSRWSIWRPAWANAGVTVVLVATVAQWISPASRRPELIRRS